MTAAESTRKKRILYGYIASYSCKQSPQGRLRSRVTRHHSDKDLGIRYYFKVSPRANVSRESRVNVNCESRVHGKFRIGAECADTMCDTSKVRLR